MNVKKYIAAAMALSSLLAASGCAQEQPVEESSEPVSINTDIDPHSIVFDWQSLYEDKLNQFKSSEGYSERSRFDIRDLNSDGIPELIISPDNEPKTVCQIFTYTDGIEQLEDLGAGGTFKIIPSLNSFGYEYTGDGFTFGEYCTLAEGKLTPAVTYYNNAASASAGAVIKYEINSEEVSLVEYENALKNYVNTASLSIGRKYTFGKEAIDYAIHCSESWGAVLSDAQKSIYKNLLNDILKNSPENDAAFELCDLDGNKVPELVLSTGIAEDSDCRVYYLNEAAIADLGNGCGKQGFFCFDMKNNVFFSEGGAELQCWSLTESDLSGYKKSESYMECGRKYLLTGDGINAAFL